MAILTNKFKSNSARGGLAIILVAAIALEAISCLMYFTSRVAIRQEAEQRAKTELRRAELEIDVHAIEMETAAKTLALLAEKHINEPDSIFAATRLAVNTLRANTSMAVAFIPNYFPKRGEFFEACSSRFSEDSIYTRQIGSAEHDYTQMEWWQNGFVHDSCWWCEPYLDDSGSKTYVVSCSCPVRDRNGKVVAVVCIDMSLDELKNISEYLQVYPNSHYTIRSSSGMDIVPAPDTVPGRKYNIFGEEIDATGWHIEIIIPDDELFRDLNHIGRIVAILMLLGLAMLILIVWYAGRNNKRLIESTARNQSIENELNIARKIQMAMLPNRFPPFSDYPNINAYGEVIPAKEVGGDLFDFYIRENKLFFCVGDVSGKGVPASIVMAMTRSFFRSFSSYLNSPAQIVTQMNDSLSGEGNDQSMFVTLFLGVLDLSTGELKYCNAGHNAPIKVRGERLEVRGGSLSCVPNLPIGVLSGFEYKEQETKMEVGDTLFLYTDGLTEAENSAHEQFGEQRMAERLSVIGERTPQEIIEAMQQAVASFVGEAEQSDDLTMFAIRLLNKSQITNDQSPMPEGHYSLVMRNDIQQIPTLAEWLEMIGLPQELNMPINLALEEAVSNVMLYAYPGKSGQVLVECDKKEKQLIFTISDSGVPFDPTQQEDPDVTQSAEERPIGGLGIFLVRQIMDDIRYERKDNKNILTLTKRI
ncbi:MAG: SpoIIE family protein phosphatase [Paludibacteraceae bacterium]|nr:SpoIIE family protein phosphatase [Paludibacteraceae bacterium]